MPYVPIITPANLSSVAYQEIIDEITRNDGGALATEAIDTAIQEVKMYVTRYDIVQLFGDPTAGTSATFTDSYLSRMVKDIAMWHLLQLANANISYESAKGRYDEAIETLKRIQKGTADPRWPEQDATTETQSPVSDSVLSIQFPKRNNGY